MKRQSIEFVEARKPIRERVTKFGGQPVWLTEAQWPLSAASGRPMRFICQIAVSPELFGATSARMAYVFMTDDEAYVDGTWEPDGGENAVILQPGSTALPVEPLTEGPTLYRMVKKFFRTQLVPEPCEFAVQGPVTQDPAYVPESVRAAWPPEQWEAYANALDGNKIGGTPIFVQGDEFPGPGSWQLLLELDSTGVPFFVNFGDAGVGYAFLSDDGGTGKFLWQSA
ncbi:hypothetical protein CDN99_25435 [Roseateles aquatilis]|uniref:DUF1963 domain-containing protein n=1 Tax=Roseateles aquatilis TaxID=431061 RepID=A0A246IU99_9BURK|nr:DUF1963 domain-containing protein [Roseateles aquatilis]OWQ83811.1 hypothetical protein CDN99_25435 [Roseateles aquatilis]